MKRLLARIVIVLLACAPLAGALPAAAQQAKGEPVHIGVGYFPSWNGGWSGVVIKKKELWKKYLPPGSTVRWDVVLVGFPVFNSLLADKIQIGYLGDAPAMVATTKRETADLRIVSLHHWSPGNICAIILVRPDAPDLKSPQARGGRGDGREHPSGAGIHDVAGLRRRQHRADHRGDDQHRPGRAPVQQSHLDGGPSRHAVAPAPLSGPAVMIVAQGARMGGGLRIDGVGKVYDPGGAHVVALEDVSLDIGTGEFCVVVGPSGCGKTTLLNIIAGFDGVTSGEIAIDGRLLASPGRRLAPGADRMVVFQNGALFPWKTVLWNVTCGPLLHQRLSRDEAEARARELLAQVGLAGIDRQYPGELSGGMKRRVEIVRALMNDPEVLLLDEPFRALDALTKSVMHECLLQLFDWAPKTVFFITHDLEEAIFLGDRVVVMTTRPGRVKKVIKVDLPRPRDYRMLSTPRYLALKAEAVDAIHEEALKAFEAGERELA